MVLKQGRKVANYSIQNKACISYLLSSVTSFSGRRKFLSPAGTSPKGYTRDCRADSRGSHECHAMQWHFSNFTNKTGEITDCFLTSGQHKGDLAPGWGHVGRATGYTWQSKTKIKSQNHFPYSESYFTPSSTARFPASARAAQSHWLCARQAPNPLYYCSSPALVK